MMGVTHGASGAAAGLAVGLLAPNPAVGLVCGVVGYLTAYAPDLDHKSATATKVLWVAGWALCLALRAISRALTGTAHRGITHSLLFAGVVGGAAGLIAGVWLPASVAVLLGLSGFAGVVAALAGDAVTRAGLDHVLWPLEWRLNVPKALRVRTGSWVELALILPLLVVGAVVLGGLVVVG
jgi:membrane-bound metal-dependent hydrolase YbcI (DUF457 family)